MLRRLAAAPDISRWDAEAPLLVPGLGGEPRSADARLAALLPRVLLPSANRVQYERWRDALIEHERAHPSKFGKGPSPCSEPGCDKPCADAGCVAATTTVRPAIEELAQFIGGFVAAEGCFTVHGSRGFRFNVGLGASDGGMCELIAALLGVGYVTRSERRQPHYDDEVQFTVQATRDLVGVVVPFMDAHLPESYKRQQYLEWRERLLDYWEHGFRRRKRCAVDQCDAPAKAHGLCRRDLWQIRRQ